MIQSFKRPLIDEPTPLKTLKGWTLERNIYALIKSRASNAIPARWRYFRAILVFPGPNLSAYSSLITVYFIEMLGRGRGRGKRSFAWLLQAIQVSWKFLSMLAPNVYTPNTHTIFALEICLISSGPDFHLSQILFSAKEKIFPNMESHPFTNVIKASNLKTLPRNKMAGFQRCVWYLKINPLWIHNFNIDFIS